MSDNIELAVGRVKQAIEGVVGPYDELTAFAVNGLVDAANRLAKTAEAEITRLEKRIEELEKPHPRYRVWNPEKERYETPELPPRPWRFEDAHLYPCVAASDDTEVCRFPADYGRKKAKATAELIVWAGKQLDAPDPGPD